MEETIKNHSFKIKIGSAIVVSGFLIYWTFIGTGLINKINETRDLAERNKSVNVVLQAESVMNKIQMGKIEVELANINTTLLEIKNELRNHDR